MAIGNYISLGVGGKAEVAFLVHDEFQGRGISTLLLERLAGIAAGYGFIGFEAEVLYENQPMINVFRDSGFEVCQAEGGGGCIHVQFPVSGLASLRERVELRDRIAVANSLVPLLKPRAVAVVGASRDPSAVGSMIFRAILRGGFTGTVYPVNNQTASVHSVRAYPSMADLPERADLAVVAVPAAKVLEVAEEALRAGTKALLVVTSGFGETGPEGAARQRELVTLVRSHGARLVGPNCLGVMNTHPETCLNASLAPDLVPRDGSASSRIRPRSASSSSTTPRSAASASPRSSRRGTAPTSRGTTSSSTGRRTSRRTSPCSTWRRSATRAASPASRGACRTRSRSSA